jgi:uncharacterized protein (DUF486 family)
MSPIQPLSSYLLPIFLLVGSNAFMTTAWGGAASDGHLHELGLGLHLKSPLTRGQGFGFMLIATGAFFVFQVPK